MAAPASDRSDSPDDEGRRVCLGVIVGVHGVRGTVRVKPFTESPEAIGDYGPVGDAAGRRSWNLRVHGMHKGVVLCSLEGVADRDMALALKGTQLYVERAALPEVEEPDTFYHADLIGLRVVDPDGRDLGTVAAVQDFGAGDLLEIRAPDGAEWLLPFTVEAVPEIDVAGGRIVAEPPPTSPDEGA